MGYSNYVQPMARKFNIVSVRENNSGIPYMVWTGISEQFGVVVLTEVCWAVGDQSIVHLIHAAYLFKSFEQANTAIVAGRVIQKEDVPEFDFKPHVILDIDGKKGVYGNQKLGRKVLKRELGSEEVFRLLRNKEFPQEIKNENGPRLFFVEPVKVEDGVKYYQCHYCGSVLPKDKMTEDHKTPKSKGGKRNRDNLVPACNSCNNKKDDMDYEDYIALIKSK